MANKWDAPVYKQPAPGVDPMAAFLSDMGGQIIKDAAAKEREQLRRSQQLEDRVYKEGQLEKAYNRDIEREEFKYERRKEDEEWNKQEKRFYEEGQQEELFDQQLKLAKIKYAKSDKTEIDPRAKSVMKMYEEILASSCEPGDIACQKQRMWAMEEYSKLNPFFTMNIPEDSSTVEPRSDVGVPDFVFDTAVKGGEVVADLAKKKGKQYTQDPGSVIDDVGSVVSKGLSTVSGTGQQLINTFNQAALNVEKSGTMIKELISSGDKIANTPPQRINEDPSLAMENKMNAYKTLVKARNKLMREDSTNPEISRMNKVILKLSKDIGLKPHQL